MPFILTASEDVNQDFPPLTRRCSKFHALTARSQASNTSKGREGAATQQHRRSQNLLKRSSDIQQPVASYDLRADASSFFYFGPSLAIYIYHFPQQQQQLTTGRFTANLQNLPVFSFPYFSIYLFSWHNPLFFLFLSSVLRFTSMFFPYFWQIFIWDFRSCRIQQVSNAELLQTLQ